MEEKIIIAPRPLDIVDLHFKLVDHVPVTKFAQLPSTNVSKVAIANSIGALFVATDFGLRVFQTLSLSQSPLCKDIGLGKQVTHIAVNSDETLLAIALKDDLVCQLYSLDLFKQQGTLHMCNSIRVSAATIDLSWNPAVENCITILHIDGSLTLAHIALDGSGGININSLPPQAAARCYSWSPKGKQIVVGGEDGTLTQYKPETLKPMKAIPSPSHALLNAPVAVISVHWLSSFQFAAVYRNRHKPDEPPAFVIVTANKNEPIVYVNYYDLTYGSPGNAFRPGQFYMIHIQQWNMLLVSSAHSSDVALLRMEADGGWTQLQVGDSSRATLPLNQRDDTYPVGWALDLSNSEAIQWENELLAPMPRLLLLSHTGLLSMFNIVNLFPNVPVLCSAPATAIPNDGFFELTGEKSQPKFGDAPKAAALEVHNSAPIPAVEEPALHSSLNFLPPVEQSVAKEKILPKSTDLPPIAESTVAHAPVRVKQDVIQPEQIPPAEAAPTAVPEVDESIYINAIIDEVAHFAEELHDFHRAQTNAKVGSDLELSELGKRVQMISSVIEELNTTVEEQGDEIKELKSLLLEQFGQVHAAKAREARKHTTVYLQLRRAEPLDPINASLRRQMLRLKMAVEMQLMEVKSHLDVEWDQFQMQCRPEKQPFMDVIYKTLDRHMKVLARQQLLVSMLQKQLQRTLKVNFELDSLSPTQSQDRFAAAHRGESVRSIELSRLAENLLDSAKQDYKVPCDTSGLDQLLLNTHISSTRQFTPDELTSLTDALSDRDVTKILCQRKVPDRDAVKKAIDRSLWRRRKTTVATTISTPTTSSTAMSTSTGISSVVGIAATVPAISQMFPNSLLSSAGNTPEKAVTTVIANIPSSASSFTPVTPSIYSKPISSGLDLSNFPVSTVKGQTSLFASPMQTTKAPSPPTQPAVATPTSSTEQQPKTTGEPFVFGATPMSKSSSILSSIIFDSKPIVKVSEPVVTSTSTKPVTTTASSYGSPPAFSRPSRSIFAPATGGLLNSPTNIYQPQTTAAASTFSFAQITTTAPADSSTFSLSHPTVTTTAAATPPNFFNFATKPIGNQPLTVTTCSNLPKTTSASTFSFAQSSFGLPVAKTTATETISTPFGFGFPSSKPITTISASDGKASTTVAPSNFSFAQPLIGSEADAKTSSISTSVITPSNFSFAQQSVKAQPIICPPLKTEESVTITEVVNVTSSIATKAETSITSSLTTTPSTTTLTITSSSELPTSTVAPAFRSSGTTATTITTTTTTAAATTITASTPSQQSSIFGTSVFTTPTSTTKGLFAPSTTFASPPTTNIFAATSTATTAGRLFGTSTTTTSGFFSTSSSLFGQPTSTTTSTTTATTTAEPLATTSTTATTESTSTSAAATTPTSSIFGGNVSNTNNIFDQTANLLGSSGFGLGSTPAATTSTANIFGQPPTSQQQSIFSSPSAPNVFGQSQSSIFGQPATTSSSSSFFGQQICSPFGSTAGSTVPSTQSIFGGVTPSTSVSSPFATKPSVFGQNTFGQQSSGASIFGSSSNFGSSFGSFGSGQSNATTGPFSGGQGNIAQSGFGTTAAFNKPTAGFGSAPIFGSPTSSFGSSATFGNPPAFGAPSSFGSPQKVFGSSIQQGNAFGSTSPQQPTAFESLANQNSLGFGNLAQQSPPNTFGSGFNTGFGSQSPAPPSTFGSNQPRFGGNSFSSWR